MSSNSCHVPCRSLPTCLYSYPLFLSIPLPFSRSVSHSSSSVSHPFFLWSTRSSLLLLDFSFLPLVHEGAAAVHLEIHPRLRYRVASMFRQRLTSAFRTRELMNRVVIHAIRRRSTIGRLRVRYRNDHPLLCFHSLSPSLQSIFRPFGHPISHRLSVRSWYLDFVIPFNSSVLPLDGALSTWGMSLRLLVHVFLEHEEVGHVCREMISPSGLGRECKWIPPLISRFLNPWWIESSTRRNSGLFRSDITSAWGNWSGNGRTMIAPTSNWKAFATLQQRDSIVKRTKDFRSTLDGAKFPD